MPAFSRLCVFLTLGAVGLGGCAAPTYQTFTKAGARDATVAQDQTACNVEANRLFPAANYPVTYPGSGGFYGTGYYGGGWGLGVTYVGSTDVNAGMRNQHRSDCMRLKGYTPVTYPVCTTAQLDGRSYAAATGAPAPAPNICAVRRQGAAPVLIDLNKPL
ncbi:hypothetical protein [Shimia sp. SDUM112013]|uniref:hypothetical protein n=1 Tax=Shimia sp. SDUM112013 TaxID=3136160 RepID=UPI0032EEB57C